jgi:hypothetical protein
MDEKDWESRQCLFNCHSLVGGCELLEEREGWIADRLMSTPRTDDE